MDAQYKRHAHIGPGGMKCPCCAPAPGSDRAAAKRHWKRSERQAWKGEAALDAERARLPFGEIYEERDFLPEDFCENPDCTSYCCNEEIPREWFEDWSEGCAA